MRREHETWQPGDGTTLYVHVPFCVVKCGYCDFNSFADPSTDAHDRFLAALDAELALVRGGAALLTPPTVFVGGGTPTYLDPARFERLFAILARHVDLGAAVEVTIEANPESLTVEKARIARAAGVTRFSVGAQTFDAARLQFLDRAHDADGVRRAVAALREVGADNLSVDLMFGLPGQTPAEWRADLDAALALGPDHLSCYNLTPEPGTRLTRDIRQGRVTMNDPDVDLELFLLTRSVLGDAGFAAYEVSNFAGGGGPCRHNDHYWLQGDYEGVGPGAASHRQGRRATNLKPLHAWAEAVERGDRPEGSDVEQLDAEQRAAEAIWLGLRRRDGVDLGQIEARTAFEATVMFDRAAQPWFEREWLRRDGDRLVMTAAGLPFADTIAESFLGGAQ